MQEQERTKSEDRESTPSGTCVRDHLPIREILAATDFLPVSRLALDYAAVFASRFTARLTVFHSFEYGPYGKTVELVDKVPCLERRDAEARTKALCSGIKNAGVDASWSVEEGQVPSTVLSAVKKLDADLLVMGTQGVHRGVSHLVVGSNTEAIMLNASIPTLTIGPHVHAGLEPEGGFSKVYCFVDFSPESAHVAMYALGIARAFNCPVELQHYDASPNTSDIEGMANDAVHFCRAICDFGPAAPSDWSNLELRLSRVVRLESPVPGSTDPTSLLVMRARRQTTFNRHLHISWPYKLLAEAICPVLTVPLAAI